MKLFLLTRSDDEDVGYDEFDAKLVRAPDEATARSIANLRVGDEGNIWVNESKVECDEITADGESGVIIESFNAG